MGIRAICFIISLQSLSEGTCCFTISLRSLLRGTFFNLCQGVRYSKRFLLRSKHHAVMEAGFSRYARMKILVSVLMLVSFTEIAGREIMWEQTTVTKFGRIGKKK